MNTLLSLCPKTHKVSIPLFTEALICMFKCSYVLGLGADLAHSSSLNHISLQDMAAHLKCMTLTYSNTVRFLYLLST